MRRRLTLLSGLAVAVTAVLASVATYLVVQGELRGQVDDSLRTATRLAQRVSEDGPPPRPPRGARPPAGLGGPRFVGAIVDSNGGVQDPLGSGERLPRDSRFAEVAGGRRDAFFADVDSRGDHLRMYVSPIGNNRAAAVARSVDEYDEVLDRLRLLFAAIALAGAIAAALLGRAVANASVAPIERLQEASEHVAQTQDLARRIDETGPR